MARKVVIIYYDGKPIHTVIGMYSEKPEELLERVKKALTLAASTY